jgi:hypothetical protein
VRHLQLRFSCFWPTLWVAILTGEVQDPEQGLVLFRSPGAGQFGSPDKLTTGEIWLPLGPTIFERAGSYEIVVFADGIEVDRTGFKVTSG